MANLSSSFNQRLEEFFRGAAETEWVSDRAAILSDITAFSSAKEDKTARAFEVFKAIVADLLSSSYTTAAEANNVSGGLFAMEKLLDDRLQFMFAAHNLSEAIKAVVGNLPSPLPPAELQPSEVEPQPEVEEPPAEAG